MAKAKNSIKGGYRFKYFDGLPAEKIVTIDAPERLSIPLTLGNTTAVNASVKKGDGVKAGQLIADGPIHSPVDGTVADIADQSTIVIEKAPGFTLDIGNPGHGTDRGTVGRNRRPGGQGDPAAPVQQLPRKPGGAEPTLRRGRQSAGPDR